jgi:glutathione peroxidase
MNHRSCSSIQEDVSTTNATESFFDLRATTLDGKDQPLCEYSGKVVLVANTASECGFTPQYAFPMFAKTETKGEGQSPVFAFLTAKHPRPRWNFYKYLVGRDGQVIDHFVSLTKPDSKRVRRKIEAALGTTS